MKPETSTALEASITHWEQNANAKYPSGVHASSKYCALCQRFFNSGNCCGLVDGSVKHDVEACPVAIKTKWHGCMKSPYIDAYLAWQMWKECGADDGISRKAAAKFRKAAFKEVAFLKSLRDNNQE